MKLFKLTAAIVLIFTVIISLTISSHASEAVDGAKKDYDNFKTEMSAKLDKVEIELAELKAKAKHQGSNVKNETIVELENTKVKLKAELENMKQTSKSGWKKFKSNFAKSMDKLNSKVQKKLND